jgi:alpha-L-rhamnosidase
VTVPPGTTATLHLPAADPDSVTEGGRPVRRSTGVAAKGTEKGKAVFELQSGAYQFAAKAALR